LEEQHAVHVDNENRKRKLRDSERKLVTRMRELLLEYGGVFDENVDQMTDLQIRDSAQSIVWMRSEDKLSWSKVFKLANVDLVAKLGISVRKHKGVNKLRHRVESALRYNIILSDDETVLAKQVRAHLNHMRKVLTLEAGEGVMNLLEEFHLVFPIYEKQEGGEYRERMKKWERKKEKSIPMPTRPLFIRRPTPAPVEIYPCVIAGVNVPSPWYQKKRTGEVSNECFAPQNVSKDNGVQVTEKCCGMSTPDQPLCVAIFIGYTGPEINAWIKHCRMPHWGKVEKVKTFPCKIKGVTVPHPWFKKETRSKQCFAPKGEEKCCDAKSPIEGRMYCVAVFDGYSHQDMKTW